MGKKLIIKQADFSENGILNPSYNVVLDYTTVTKSHRPLVAWGQDSSGIPVVIGVKGRSIRYIMIFNDVQTPDSLYPFADEVKLYRFNLSTNTGSYIGSYVPTQGDTPDSKITVDLGSVVTFGNNEVLVLAGFINGEIAYTSGNSCNIGVGIYNSGDSTENLELLRNPVVDGDTISGTPGFLSNFRGLYPDSLFIK
jgi:hypothetical protein